MSRYRAIVIGGSAGSFQEVTKILKTLPKDFKTPIILCLHRLKHIKEGFVEALNIKSQLEVIEPYDKQKIKPGSVYLAPANYHLLCELTYTFALSTEEMVNYSRPSIDLTLQNVGFVYKKRTLGIILSGANKDGALGLKKIKDYGGTVIIQDRNEARVKTMPEAANRITEIDYELKTEDIIEYILESEK